MLVGTCRSPDGTVHLWFTQTLGSFEADLVPCDTAAQPGLGSWSYVPEARVTCEACKGRWGSRG